MTSHHHASSDLPIGSAVRTPPVPGMRSPAVGLAARQAISSSCSSSVISLSMRVMNSGVASTAARFSEGFSRPVTRARTTARYASPNVNADVTRSLPCAATPTGRPTEVKHPPLRRKKRSLMSAVSGRPFGADERLLRSASEAKSRGQVVRGSHNSAYVAPLNSARAVIDHRLQWPVTVTRRVSL
jgi:hypothetical protein